MHRLFFYLTIFLLPTQLGYHIWPQWSLVLGRRVDYLSPTLYLTDIFIFLTLSSWFLERISKIKNQKDKYIFLPCVAVSFVVVNIVLSTNVPVAIYSWLRVAELGLFGWYVARTKPRISMVALFLAGSVIYSSAIAVVQFILQRSAGGLLWFLGERTFTIDTPGIARIDLCNPFTSSCRQFLRSYATFPHPNVLGGYLAVVLPLVTMEIIGRIGRIRQIGWIVVSMGIVALILSFSRSAMLVGAVGVALANIKYQISKIKNKYQKSKIKTRILYFVCSIFLVIGGWYIVQSFQGESESVIIRSQLNHAAINLWRQSPIVGVGLGNFLVKLPETLVSREIYFLQPVHNIYLLILTETGVLGLLIFSLMIWRLLRSKKQEARSKFMLPLLSLLALGLVDHYPVTLQQGRVLLALLIGLAL